MQPIQPPTPFQYDVAIAGGGPVGLWTAAQLKILNPHLNVVIYEKNETYQRSHVVALSSSSFKNIPNDPRLQKLVNEIKAKPLIPTNELEAKLVALVNSLGIKIIRKKIDDPREISAKVVVGADGAHSNVREKVFGGEFRLQQDFQYIAEVKYQVHGNGRRLQKLSEAYPTLKLMHAVATEHVGSERNGKTPITLRVFIDKPTYERMQGATFRNPFNLVTHYANIESELKKSIGIWLRAKEVVVGEKRVEGSEQLTVTKLGVYVSKSFVKTDPVTGQVTCLVGDAAFGVPFFRSLNNGLLCGTKLADALTQYFNPPKTSLKLQSPLAAYESSVGWLASYEVFIARMKNLVIRMYSRLVRFASFLPYQIIKWSDTQEYQFRLRSKPEQLRIKIAKEQKHMLAMDQKYQTNQRKLNSFNRLHNRVIQLFNSAQAQGRARAENVVRVYKQALDHQKQVIVNLQGELARCSSAAA